MAPATRRQETGTGTTATATRPPGRGRTTGDGDGDGDATTGDGDGDGETTSGDGDGDATSGDGDGEPCFEADYDFSVVPPNILFLLDKSGSMTIEWYDGGVLTRRWESLYNVVANVTTALDDHVRFGAKLYPSVDAGSCGVDPGVEVPFALDNAATLLATIPAPEVFVNGSTPTHSGVEEALVYLDAVYAADPTGTPPQALVLVADGGVSCNESAAATEAAIAAAAAQSPNPIPTYVVGIDISAFNDDQMNAYAIAGGTALPGATSFYQTTDGAALAAAFDAIVADAQTCDVVLDPPPFGEDLIDVTLGGVAVPKVTDCATEDGFVFPDPGDLTQLLLCGAACDELKAVGNVSVAYTCPGGG